MVVFLTLDEFVLCVHKLHSLNIEIVVHIINGLPGEDKKMMLETITFLNTLPIQGIKFHSLLIIKNTALAKEFSENPFPILSLEEYVDITCSQIEILRDDIIVHRIAADSSLDDLIVPKWTHKKLVVMNEIDKELRKRDTYQGIFYKK